MPPRWSRGWNRTNFLQLMRLASYRCSSPELETRSASRICAGLSPLPTGCVALYALADFEMVGHLGAAPSISPIRTARIAVFLVPEDGATGSRTPIYAMPLRRLAVGRWPRKWTRAPDSHRVDRFCRPMARRLYLARDESGEANGIRTRTTAFTEPDAALTSWPPFETDPATGAAPVWSRLQGECMSCSAKPE